MRAVWAILAGLNLAALITVGADFVNDTATIADFVMVIANSIVFILCIMNATERPKT